ncbi:MAG: hypothetical protein H6741_00360 [Alphaproteobacteria bacterium]|nr:hypothetical protein [Alphaproteobacteria bacterium]MCB9791156.1 hypothetical protein [Alphaproteobacteria bacterium]
MTAVVLLMIGTFGLSTWNLVHNFDQEALMANLQEHAATTVWPLVSAELDKVAEDALPAISAAMAKEAENLLPRLGERLSAEAAIFEKNMSKRMQESLDRDFAAALAEQDAALRAKLPDLSKDSALYDDLLRRLQASARVWAQEQLDGIFAEHIHVLQSINESVVVLGQQAASERGERGEVSPEDTLSLFIELLNTRMNEGG